jgi:OmpA-OmpF porin, OOP family
VRTEPLLLSAVYSFLPENHLTPILVVGAGKASVQNIKATAYDTFAAQAGLGLEYYFTPGFAAGLLVRENWAFVKPDDNGEYSNSVAATNVGLILTYYFGASKPEPVVQAPAPAPAPTPAPVVVQEVTKPADTDGDGVPDSMDKEPNTPQGNLVDKDGVTLSEIVTISMNIMFDSSKAVVKPEFDVQIKKVADFLTMYPTTTAVIEGHTDNSGLEKKNMDLSLRRANSVRDYLIKNFNIDGARLATIGYGSAKPVADNASLEGRQANRRVVATISTTKQMKK